MSKDWDRYAQGCQSPLMSHCLKTAPVANLDASDSTEKCFVLSGIIRTGASVNFCFSVSNTV